MELDGIQIENPYDGFYVYKNALPKKLGLIDDLEKALSENTHDVIKWSPALVGDRQSMPGYRDCVNFKVRKSDIELNPVFKDSLVASVYNSIDVVLQKCLKHYTSLFNITMEYQEAVNFVKYEVNEHYGVHSDSGFSYTCNVSSIMYLNDNYEGGELFFPYIKYTYTPEEGDVVLFPSSWLFAHASLPVKSGVKYVAVTMFDYTDRYHTPEIRQLLQRKYSNLFNK